ncbi:MAG: superoxide dismutase [Candidatus Bostrichicola ureolyticus]|nr:MAG: superoxide dismutase [Candidatus Bostrichicola ureolyticus]
MYFKLPILSYKYNALEPYIDSMTMEIHHTKHHASYTLNLNNAIKELNLCEQSIEQILKKNIDNPTIRNNGGGYYNHNFFWKIICPKTKNNIPSESLIVDINNKFGSFENFKKIFSNVAIKHFGSGWAWLYLNVNNELTINSTINQDNPLMDNMGIPIIALDVWEHAYYLRYQNRRNEYIEAFWNIINWSEISKNYDLIKSNK